MALPSYELDIRNKVKEKIKAKTDIKKELAQVADTKKKADEAKAKLEQEKIKAEQAIRKKQTDIVELQLKKEQAKKEVEDNTMVLFKPPAKQAVVNKIGATSASPSDAKSLMKEQINTAFQNWQISQFGGGSNAKNTITASEDAIKILSDSIGTAVANYVSSLELTLLPRTVFGTGGGPIVYPWTPATPMPSNNHGYFSETAAVIAAPTEIKERAGKPISVDYTSAPLNRI